MMNIDVWEQILRYCDTADLMNVYISSKQFSWMRDIVNLKKKIYLDMSKKLPYNLEKLADIYTRHLYHRQYWDKTIWRNIYHKYFSEFGKQPELYKPVRILISTTISKLSYSDLYDIYMEVEKDLDNIKTMQISIREYLLAIQ